MMHSSGLEVAGVALLSGSFRNREDAERAYHALIAHGYSPDEITVLMSEEARKRHFPVVTATSPLATRAADGGAVGGAVGGATGGMLIGVGIPEKHARLYETDLKNGNIMLTVVAHSEDDVNAVSREWVGFDAGNIFR